MICEDVTHFALRTIGWFRGAKVEKIWELFAYTAGTAIFSAVFAVFTIFTGGAVGGPGARGFRIRVFIDGKGKEKRGEG
jgi:hypothetical protein